MPRKKKAPLPNGKYFGERLAELRKVAGYTLEELGREVGVSKRMLCYYESQGGEPPVHLLPKFAKALGVGADELLGTKPIKRNGSTPQRSRLWNRLKQIEKLSPQDRRHIVKVLDALIQTARPHIV